MFSAKEARSFLQNKENPGWRARRTVWVIVVHCIALLLIDFSLSTCTSSRELRLRLHVFSRHRCGVPSLILLLIDSFSCVLDAYNGVHCWCLLVFLYLFTHRPMVGQDEIHIHMYIHMCISKPVSCFSLRPGRSVVVLSYFPFVSVIVWWFQLGCNIGDVLRSCVSLLSVAT